MTSTLLATSSRASCAQTFRIALCGSFFDQDVLAFDIAERGKTLEKHRTILRGRRSVHRAKPKDANARSLRLALSVAKSGRDKQAHATCQKNTAARDHRNTSTRGEVGPSYYLQRELSCSNERLLLAADSTDRRRMAGTLIRQDTTEAVIARCDRGRKSTSQIALYSTIVTLGGVRRPPRTKWRCVFTQPRPGSGLSQRLHSPLSSRSNQSQRGCATSSTQAGSVFPPATPRTSEVRFRTLLGLDGAPRPSANEPHGDIRKRSLVDLKSAQGQAQPCWLRQSRQIHGPGAVARAELKSTCHGPGR